MMHSQLPPKTENRTPKTLILRYGMFAMLVAVCVWRGIPTGWAEEDFLTAAATAGNRAGVLVLKTGQLVEGRISSSAGGYLVELPKGNYLVPFERVQVVAETPHGAYEKLKAGEVNPTPAFQVALARWCIAWKLYEEARLELRDALIAEPDHQEARQMYASLQQLMHPEQQPPAKPAPKTNTGFQAADPESLAGLSPEAARQYVIRVQPVLLNRCGNAGCHAPAAEREFRISHVHRGLNRQTLENLDAVLKLVDIHSPDDSPLLKTPSGTHGRNGRPIFFGNAGEQNLETLKDWIEMVVADLAGDTHDKSKTGAFARLDPFDKQPDETLIRGVPEEPKPLPSNGRPVDEKEELLDSILRNEQPDAFDPEEFNRKFGR